MDLAQVHRPFDQLVLNGPPVDPIPFPTPVVAPGMRKRVLYLHNGTPKSGEDALMHDHSRTGGSENDLIIAYLALPNKEPIKTIMGHVRICAVLRRSVTNTDDQEILFESTDELVAIKVSSFRKMQQFQGRYAEDPRNEVAAMQLIGNEHPNVIGCTNVLFDGESLNIVLPYINGVDLFHVLHENRQVGRAGMEEGEARFWFRQICEGIKHLHGIGICHRDLSTENVMIAGNRASIIIDMGMACRVPYTNPLDPAGPSVDITIGTQKRLMKPQGPCGKKSYISPEIFRNEHPFDGGAVDIWSAGIILFRMLTGCGSYERADKSDRVFLYMTRDLPSLLRHWEIELSKEAVDLLRGMFKVEPRDRLTLEEVMAHSWFTQPDANAE